MRSNVTTQDERKSVTAMNEDYKITIEDSDVWPFVLTAEEQEESRIESIKLEREEEKRMLLTNIIKQKYGNDEESWVKTLTNEQLDALSLSMFTKDTLQELKKKIEHNS